MREAAELRSNGMSWNAIARTLGITTETAKCWADPEYKKARQERINEMRRQRRANGHVPVARGARRPSPQVRPVVIPRNLTLMELARGECKWPVNNAARGEEHLFCGNPAQGSYCPHHAARSVTTEPGWGYK